MYYNLQLLRCSTYYFGATMRPETIRANHVSKVTVRDTVWWGYQELYFDSTGKLSGTYVDHTRNLFTYDSLLESKGILRMATIESEIRDDGVSESWTSIFTYDEYGNITAIRYTSEETGKSTSWTYVYSDSGRYQYVEIRRPEEDREIWKYDQRSNKLRCLNYDSNYYAFEAPAAKRRKWNAKADTIRYFEEDFDCVDTGSSRIFYSLVPAGDVIPVYRIRRDSGGNLIDVQGEWESWFFVYGANGLPIEMQRTCSYWIADEPELQKTVARYVYTYY